MFGRTTLNMLINDTGLTGVLHPSKKDICLCLLGFFLIKQWNKLIISVYTFPLIDFSFFIEIISGFDVLW